jgi:hypothetical protein
MDVNIFENLLKEDKIIREYFEIKSLEFKRNNEYLYECEEE